MCNENIYSVTSCGYESHDQFFLRDTTSSRILHFVFILTSLKKLRSNQLIPVTETLHLLKQQLLFFYVYYMYMVYKCFVGLMLTQDSLHSIFSNKNSTFILCLCRS